MSDGDIRNPGGRAAAYTGRAQRVRLSLAKEGAERSVRIWRGVQGM